MLPDDTLTYFTAAELAEAASLLSGEHETFIEPGPPPTDEVLEEAGITGGYRVEGRSYGIETLALLSMTSPALAAKVERYLNERGWDTPDVIDWLEETKRKLAGEPGQSD